jgi:hypothetical protein
MKPYEVNYRIVILIMITLFEFDNVSSQGMNDDKINIKHRFAVVDIRRNKAMIISENRDVEWQYDINTPTDIHLLKSGNILVAGIKEVVELNYKKELIWKYSSKTDLFSAISTKKGNYLVGCSEDFKLIELDKKYKHKRNINTVTENKNGHMHSRHVRRFSDGTYWVALCIDGLINAYNKNGELLRSISVRKLSEKYGLSNFSRQQAYSIEELPNGHILVSAGFPALVAEIDKNGNLIWGLSSNDVPKVNFIFSGGAKRLSNGNTLICNWTGHNFAGDYVPVFEVNMEKQVVWTFNDKQLLPEPLGIDIEE